MPITVTPSTSGTPAAQNNGFAAGTITFSNLNGGTNFPACKVVVGLFSTGATTVPTSPLIGGVTANAIFAGSGTSTPGLSFYYADVSAGTTDNFTFTNGSAYSGLACIAWQLSGAATGAPNAFVQDVYPGAGNNPQTLPAITINSGDVAIVWGATGITGGVTPTWTNTTNNAGGDQITSSATAYEIMGAHSTTVGSTVITCTGTGFAFGWGGAAATWSPASTQAPFNKFDWPVPKDFQRNKDDNSWIWYSERIVNLPNPLPKNQYDWPLPKTFPRPDENYTWFSERIVNLPNPLPKNNYDWPNPKPVTWYQHWQQTTSQTVPTVFSQHDWPLPRGPQYPMQTWLFFSEQLVNLPNPVPFNQFDWPVPRAYPPGASYVYFSEQLVNQPNPQPFLNTDQPNPKSQYWFRDWNQNLLQTTLAIVGAPFSQFDWPLPRAYSLPGQTWIVNLLENTLAPILIALPPVWSVSGIVAPIDQTWIQSLVNSTLQATAALPFNQFDWPNAQRIIWDRFWFQSPAPSTPQSPFFQTDWPLVRPYTPIQQWWVDANSQLPLPTPFFQNVDFPLPVISRPIDPTWFQNLSEFLQSETFPFVQTDWKNPYPLYWYRDHNQNIVIYVPTGALPFSQTDWPLTKAPKPIDQFYYQALVLNLPEPLPPPVITSSGRYITEAEVMSEVAQWWKRQEASSKSTINKHFSKLSALGHAVRWNTKPASSK